LSDGDYGGVVTAAAAEVGDLVEGASVCGLCALASLSETGKSDDSHRGRNVIHREST